MPGEEPPMINPDNPGQGGGSVQATWGSDVIVIDVSAPSGTGSLSDSFSFDLADFDQDRFSVNHNEFNLPIDIYFDNDDFNVRFEHIFDNGDKITLIWRDATDTVTLEVVVVFG